MRRRRFVSLQLLVTALVASTVVIVAQPAGAAPLETVTVPASDSDGVDSTTVLTAGTTYIFDARGTAAYGFQGGLSDVECSTLPPDPTWQRMRYFFVDPESDLLDVLVNDTNVEWQATNSDALGCNSANHKYTLTFTPAVSGTVNFRMYDTGYSDNQGGFVIDIHEAAETLLETLVVPSEVPSGATSTVSLDPTRFYRMETTGTFAYGTGLADAECTTFPPDPTWQPSRFILVDPDEDLVDLYINGGNVAWRAGTADPFGCNSTDHLYDVIFQPAAAGPVNFAVKDTFHGDNSGSLGVKIFRLEFTPAEGAELLSPPEISLAEQFDVDSTDPDGTTSVVPFPAGQQVLVEVTGSYVYGLGTADSRCSTVAPGTTFAPSEDNYPTLPPGTLQLVVNLDVQPWVPTTADTGEPDCNSTDHEYRLIYMPATSGQLNFRIKDSNYADNGGVITVRIFRFEEIPVGVVFVNSAMPSGTSSPPLVSGRTYRLRASGTYGYFVGVPGSALADAECSEADFPPISDPVFLRHRWGTGSADLLDVFINDANIEWLTSAGMATGCDPDNVYGHTLTASSTGPINLKIKDTNYTDNSGSVAVEFFLRIS